jgi:hypothetical protein
MHGLCNADMCSLLLKRNEHGTDLMGSQVLAVPNHDRGAMAAVAAGIVVIIGRSEVMAHGRDVGSTMLSQCQ